MTPQPLDRLHFGRSFGGPGPMEECSCGKAPCGLVDESKVDHENCDQHPISNCKTLRSLHYASNCPGAPGE